MVWMKRHYVFGEERPQYMSVCHPVCVCVGGGDEGDSHTARVPAVPGGPLGFHKPLHEAPVLWAAVPVILPAHAGHPRKVGWERQQQTGN